MLPTHQLQTINLLPEPEQLIVRAKFETLKATNVPMREGKKEIAKLLLNLLVDAGYANDSQNEKIIINLTNSLYTDMITRYKHFSLGELKLALNDGVRGEFGDFVGINITTINHWLRMYQQCPQRQTALQHFNKLLGQQTPKPPPCPATTEKLLQQAAANAYADFLADKPFTLIAKTIYNYLKAKNNITWTDAEKTEITKQATQNYHQQLQTKKRNRQITAHQFDLALKGPPNLNLEIKRVALAWYFRKLRDEGRRVIF